MVDQYGEERRVCWESVRWRSVKERTGSVVCRRGGHGKCVLDRWGGEVRCGGLVKFGGDHVLENVWWRGCGGDGVGERCGGVVWRRGCSEERVAVQCGGGRRGSWEVAERAWRNGVVG